MAVTFTEDFAGAADTLLQGKTTTTGGLTWATAGTFAIDQQGLKLNGSGAGKNSGTNGCLAYANAGSADCYAQAAWLDGFTSSERISCAVACVDHQNMIVLSTYTATSVRVLKRISNTLSQVAIISGLTLTAGDVFRLEREGTTVRAYQNGSQIGTDYTISDSVFSGVSNVGIWARGAYTSLVDDFEGGTIGSADTLTIGNGPAANQIYQRVGTSKTVVFSGSYTGTAPTDIQYQLETAGASVITAWTTISGATIGGGSFSGASVTIPQDDDWLILKLRSRDSGGTVLASAQTNTFGVGALIQIDGQSNMAGMATSGGTANTVNAAKWNGTSWTKSIGGAGERALVQELGTLLGCVVGIGNSAVGGTGIVTHQDPNANWTNTENNILGMGGDIEAVFWSQGETDAGTTDVSASYAAALQDIADDLMTLTGRTASNFRLMVGVTGRNEGSTQGNSTGWQSVRKGQADAAAAHAAIEISHDCIEFSMADGVHYDEAGYQEHGRRFARSYAKIVGASAYDARGPRITGATLAGSTVTVAFDLNGSAALTGTGTLDGWEFYNGSTWAAATDAARSGNAVTFTGAGATAVRYLYGQDPNVTTLVRGDVKASSSSAANLPVEPTRLNIAVSPAATTVSGNGASNGVGSAAGTGASIKTGVGSASGVATASGAGVAIDEGNGAANNTATASASGAAIKNGDGSAVGVATVSGASGSTVTRSGDGASAGATITIAIGSAKKIGAGVSAGMSNASAGGQSVSSGDGSAFGISTASGASNGLVVREGMGGSAASASVSGLGEAIKSGSGNAASVATVIAYPGSGPITSPLGPRSRYRLPSRGGYRIAS